MTRFELHEKIEKCKSDGYVRYCGGIPLEDIKQLIFTIISDKDCGLLKLYCSREVREWLLMKFWIDDFNYLGTRIIIVREDCLASSQPITIPVYFKDFHPNFNISILMCSEDDEPIGFFETM